MINPDVFSKLLALHDIVAQNPALSEVSVKYAKLFKPLLEVNNFPANVDKFLS
jgi:hypothetical protein